ncbi:hypothetical protein CCACVL1_27469, partial [Corchorus capsularis]
MPILTKCEEKIAGCKGGATVARLE